MSNHVVKEPTYEELKARLAELEKKMQANKPARKPVQLFITPDGQLQIRNVLKNGSAHNLEPEVPEVMFNHAKEIIDFVNQNKGLLAFSSDDSVTQETKQTQRNQLIAAENPLIRRPRVAL
jgi:hypothetical protein